MSPTNSQIESKIKNLLNDCLQPNQSIRVVRWEQRGGGEKLHDRYFLTNIGGIKFSQGIDKGQLGETTDLDILNKEQYELRWNQYLNTPAFDLAPNHFPFEVSK